MIIVGEWDYQYRRGDLQLIPYSPNCGVYKEDVLLALHKRLKEEDLWDTLFHEDAGVSLLGFMNFFSTDKTLLQILSVVKEDGTTDLAGMAWVSELCKCGGVLSRGEISFLFFRDYQSPSFTDRFGDMILEFWFEILGLDVVMGITPEPNRPARIYVKRVGGTECGRIPNWTTFKGNVVAGVITSITKEDYRKNAGR